jgi:hypothetical protein
VQQRDGIGPRSADQPVQLVGQGRRTTPHMAGMKDRRTQYFCWLRPCSARQPSQRGLFSSHQISTCIMIKLHCALHNKLIHPVPAGHKQ